MDRLVAVESLLREALEGAPNWCCVAQCGLILYGRVNHGMEKRIKWGVHASSDDTL
jgi:hypothetical protein